MYKRENPSLSRGVFYTLKILRSQSVNDSQSVARNSSALGAIHVGRCNCDGGIKFVVRASDCQRIGCGGLVSSFPSSISTSYIGFNPVGRIRSSGYQSAISRIGKGNGRCNWARSQRARSRSGNRIRSQGGNLSLCNRKVADNCLAANLQGHGVLASIRRLIVGDSNIYRCNIVGGNLRARAIYYNRCSKLAACISLGRINDRYLSPSDLPRSRTGSPCRTFGHRSSHRQPYPWLQ